MKIFTSLNYLAIFLTALLVGGLVGFVGTQSYYRGQLSNKKFLKDRLESMEKLGGGADKKTPLASVEVAEVTIGPAQEISELAGRLVEIGRTTVASEVAGKVVEMPVEDGTPVQKDETLLARVDTVWNQLAIEQSKARLAALEATLRYERSELHRIVGLIMDKAVSESEKESKEATIQELEAKILEEKAKLHELELKVRRSRIYAPFRGEVVQRFVDVGAYVNAGTPIAEIITTGEIDARIYLPENAIKRMEVGQQVKVWVDPLDKMVEGKVATILSTATSASRTFFVRVRLDDLDGMLKSGMSARAYVPVTEPFESLIVPKDGVLIRPDGYIAWLAVPKAEAETPTGAEPGERAGMDEPPVAEPVPVRVLASMPGYFAVRPETERGKEIMKPGAVIITEGAERLAAGAALKIQKNKYPLEPLPGTYPTGHQKFE